MRDITELDSADFIHPVRLAGQHVTSARASEGCTLSVVDGAVLVRPKAKTGTPPPAAVLVPLSNVKWLVPRPAKAEAKK